MREELPLVSCLCPTYGRPRLLREAIWCFLQQDYPNKELLVVNDHQEPIQLDRDYPGVIVHNLPERLKNLGEKRNCVVRLARGDYLMNWDDDDLYLPWRITEQMKLLYSNPHRWLCKSTQAWRSTNNARYRLNQSYFHGQAAMRRELFDQVGWYAAMNSGQDLELEARIPKDRWIHYRAMPSDLVYVYREGNGIAHISQFRPDQPGRLSGWERMEQSYRNAEGGIITPGFARDYWRDLSEAAAGIPGVDLMQRYALMKRLEPYHDLGGQ